MLSVSVPTRRGEVQQGLLMMVAAMLMLPGIDAVAKWLSGSVSAGQVTWSRFFFQTLLLLPLVLHRGGLRVGRKLWGHAARGLLLALATLLFFAAVGRMPLADAISVFFIEPLLLTLLSAWLLGEGIGWRRLLAVAAGFVGAMVVIRPSYQAFGAVALLPAAAGLSFALYVILTRHLVRDGSAVVMQFYAGVFGCLTMSVAIGVGTLFSVEVLEPTTPAAAEWGLLVLLGVIATAGHLLIVHAVKRVGASMVAPFQYLEIISATILGLVLFGDFPDTTTWVGVAIIIGSGLYVFHRERHLAE